MKDVNLIPASRLNARRRRRRVRLWAAGGAAYAASLLGVFLTYGHLGGGDRRAQADELDKTRARIQESRQAARAIQRDLAGAESVLQAARAVSDRPDWSIVLALLAKRLGEEVMLRQVLLKPGRIGPPSPAAAATPAGSHSPYLLKLAGYGRSQEAVSRFVLDIERTGAFDQVTLIKTSREPFLAIDAVGFQVECALGGKAGDAK